MNPIMNSPMSYALAAIPLAAAICAIVTVASGCICGIIECWKAKK